jgi:hypothetical protein
MVWKVDDRVILLSTKYANQRGVIVEIPLPRTKFFCVRLDPPPGANHWHYVTRLTAEDMVTEEGPQIGSPQKIRNGV